MVSFNIVARASCSCFPQMHWPAASVTGTLHGIIYMGNIQVDEVLLIAWFLVFGAVIGSFLNVVVYRLPKGMSLIMPPSHCPACKHRIRWFDNIPIVSWFVLQAADAAIASAAISARYPLVEAVTAGMFALLTAVEFTFKGINLPMREFYKSGNLIIITRNNPELYGILLFHLLLLCTLLAAALIEDRSP